MLVVSEEAESIYDDSGLTCRRLPISWRQYENLHVICWLAKDYSWNRANPFLWCFMIVPTLCIGFDMFLSTIFQPGHLIENAHYFAQFFWVLANVVWAFGEIFHPESDSPLPMLSFNAETYHSYRWFSSWLLVVALLPVVIMYGIWMVAMMTKNLGSRPVNYVAILNEENDQLDIIKFKCSSSNAIIKTPPYNSSSDRNNSNSSNKNVFYSDTGRSDTDNSTNNSGSSGHSKYGAIA